MHDPGGNWACLAGGHCKDVLVGRTMPLVCMLAKPCSESFGFSAGPLVGVVLHDLIVVASEAVSG